MNLSGPQSCHTIYVRIYVLLQTFRPHLAHFSTEFAFINACGEFFVFVEMEIDYGGLLYLLCIKHTYTLAHTHTKPQNHISWYCPFNASYTLDGDGVNGTKKYIMWTYFASISLARQRRRFLFFMLVWSRGGYGPRGFWWWWWWFYANKLPQFVYTEAV